MSKLPARDWVPLKYNSTPKNWAGKRIQSHWKPPPRKNSHRKQLLFTKQRNQDSQISELGT
jgi:hypothetical protein